MERSLQEFCSRNTQSILSPCFRFSHVELGKRLTSRSVRRLINIPLYFLSFLQTQTWKAGRTGRFNGQKEGMFLLRQEHTIFYEQTSKALYGYYLLGKQGCNSLIAE